MKYLSALSLIAAVVCITSASAKQPVQATLLQKVNTLPLALNDDFEFRKVKTFQLRSSGAEGDSAINRNGAGIDRMVSFESKRRLFGAVTRVDKQERRGNYFTFFWRSVRPANITIRLEYRQRNLGPYVQAQEISYENVKGNTTTEFAVIGDDYKWDGAVTSWRAILIEDGKIVGLHSSYLWN